MSVVFAPVITLLLDFKYGNRIIQYPFRQQLLRRPLSRCIFMRFKCQLSSASVETCLALLTVMTKISTLGAICLAPSSLRIALITELAEMPRAYAELPSSMFDDFRVESQSENCILFEIGLDFLLKSFQSAAGASSSTCLLKLVKRDALPCLAASFSDREIEVCHDIPVKLMPMTDLLYYSPPATPPPALSIELISRVKLLRTVVDRMARISRELLLRAEGASSRFIVAIEDPSAVVKTFFNHLPMQTSEGRQRLEEENNDDDDDEGVAERGGIVEVKVDSRRLAMVLSLSSLPLASASMRA